MSTANFIQQDVLFVALGSELELPKRRISNRDEWLEICSELADFIADSTDRPAAKGQRETVGVLLRKEEAPYSKKSMIVDPKTKKILAESAMVEGKRSDKRLFVERSVICSHSARGIWESG